MGCKGSTKEKINEDTVTKNKITAGLQVSKMEGSGVEGNFQLAYITEKHSKFEKLPVSEPNLDLPNVQEPPILDPENI